MTPNENRPQQDAAPPPIAQRHPVFAHRAWLAARDAVLAALGAAPGPVMLVGASGTGKSALLIDLAAALRDDGTPAVMLHPRTARRESPADAAAPGVSPREVLLVDNVDRLDGAALARLAGRACVLAGKPEFAARIATRLDAPTVLLGGVAPDEVAAYLRVALAQPGQSNLAVAPAAIDLLHEGADGVPRMLTAVGRMAADAARYADATTVGLDHVRAALAAPATQWLRNAPGMPPAGAASPEPRRQTPVPKPEARRAPDRPIPAKTPPAKTPPAKTPPAKTPFAKTPWKAPQPATDQPAVAARPVGNGATAAPPPAGVAVPLAGALPIRSGVAPARPVEKVSAPSIPGAAPVAAPGAAGDTVARRPANALVVGGARRPETGRRRSPRRAILPLAVLGLVAAGFLLWMRVAPERTSEPRAVSLEPSRLAASALPPASTPAMPAPDTQPGTQPGTRQESQPVRPIEAAPRPPAQQAVLPDKPAAASNIPVSRPPLQAAIAPSPPKAEMIPSPAPPPTAASPPLPPPPSPPASPPTAPQALALAAPPPQATVPPPPHAGAPLPPAPPAPSASANPTAAPIPPVPPTPPAPATAPARQPMPALAQPPAAIRSPAEAAPTPPAATAPPVLAVTPPPPPPPQAAAPLPAPPQTLATALPPSTPSPPPSNPATAGSAAAMARLDIEILPVGASTFVELRYPLGNAEARSRADALAQQLRADGLVVGKPREIAAGRPKPGVGYFYLGDEAAAVAVGTALDRLGPGPPGPPTRLDLPATSLPRPGMVIVTLGSK